MIKKFIILLAISLGTAFLAVSIGLTGHQALAIGIFLASILGTLFFWDFRLSFAFLGVTLLLLTKTIDLDHFIRYSSLEVIMFLVGMMILVGLLKENGFFAWVTQLLFGIKNLTGRKFIIVMCIVSFILAASIDEVTSIIFMVAAILEICSYIKVNPVPCVIISVLATNIGSAATVLGNPIGILIATKSGLTFEDFLVKAMPLALVCLAATVLVCLAWYRKYVNEMDAGIKKTREEGASFKHEPVVFGRDLKISTAIFAATLIFIALHHRFELLWGLERNTILLTAPLLSSGIVMIWKWQKARHYVEKNVEWWTLLFFMFLFAQAGTLKYTGATDELARRLTALTGNSLSFLTGMTLWIAAIGSSVLDNVVLVAAMIPVVQSFKDLAFSPQPLWWALLFGGCLGGNITLVGSTANIVALGILEKERNVKMTFMKWFGIGLTVGVITTVIAWAAFLILPIYK